jgi:hypothetical protein
MPPWPGALTSGSTSAYCWNSSGSAVTNSAPSAAPPTEPSPPSTIIARYWMETTSVKDSGAMLPMDNA